MSTTILHAYAESLRRVRCVAWLPMFILMLLVMVVPDAAAHGVPEGDKDSSRKVLACCCFPSSTWGRNT